MRISRRDFMKNGMIAAGATLALPLGMGGCPTLPFGLLDSKSIPKYWSPLYLPSAMPPAVKSSRNEAAATAYQVAARQFKQQVLPWGMPPTTVWVMARFRRRDHSITPRARLRRRRTRPSK